MEFINQIHEQLKKIIVGEDHLIDYSVVALLSGGHVLLEGMPGLGKTLFVRALSKALDVDFKRIQFTPDLMPSDVIGTKIFNIKTNEFELKKGPLFTNFILADEINRTPPKTQSGLLEAMEEKTISIDGEVIQLPNPYMVFATQNPIEYEGTYPLPEALMDRFLMKILVDYPTGEEEKEILTRHHKGLKNEIMTLDSISRVCTAEELIQYRKEVENVHVEDELLDYIIQIISATRRHPYVELGSSPRGSIALLHTSKAYALLKGRDFIIPDDVKAMSLPVLRHRIMLKPEVEIEGVKSDRVIENIVGQIKVPR